MNSSINFSPRNGRHTGSDIVEIFYNLLEKLRHYDKVIRITADNAFVNDVFLQEFGKILNKRGIKFDSKD